jgi:hypothetical protein
MVVKRRHTLFHVSILSYNSLGSALQRNPKRSTLNMPPANTVLLVDPQVADKPEDTQASGFANVQTLDAVMDIIDTVMNIDACETIINSNSTAVVPFNVSTSPHSVIEEVLRMPSPASSNSSLSTPDSFLPLTPTPLPFDDASIVIAEECPTGELRSTKIGDLGRRRGFKGAPIIVPTARSSLITPLSSGSAFSSTSELTNPLPLPLFSPVFLTRLPQDVHDDYSPADPFATSPESYYVPDVTCAVIPVEDLTKFAFYDDFSSKKRMSQFQANDRTRNDSLSCQRPSPVSKNISRTKTTVYDISIHSYDMMSIKGNFKGNYESITKSAANSKISTSASPNNAPNMTTLRPTKLKSVFDDTPAALGSAAVVLPTGGFPFAVDEKNAFPPVLREVEEVHQSRDGNDCDTCTGARTALGSHLLLCPPCSQRHLRSLSFSKSNLDDIGVSSPPIIVTLPSETSLARAEKCSDDLRDIAVPPANEIGWDHDENSSAGFTLGYDSEADLESAYGGLWQGDD